MSNNPSGQGPSYGMVRCADGAMRRVAVRPRWHFFHSWSPWTDTGRVHRYWFWGIGGCGEYDKTEQRRHCRKCSATDVREVRS